MRKYLMMVLLLVAAGTLRAQDATTTETTAEVPKTVFSLGGVKSSGFYGAVTNSFTSINGEFTNMSGLYGGWFINRKLLVGIGGAATNSTLRVPEQHKTVAGADLRYQYAQFGLFTEYVMNSNKKVHFVFNMLTGAGFTAQFLNNDWDDHNDHPYGNYSHDTNFFAVVEPGAQVEINLLKWVRFSPGISYRQTIGSDGKGLSDGDLSNVSANLTLKFGLF